MRFRTLTAALALSMLSFAASEVAAQRNGLELTVGVAAVGSESYDGEDSYTWLHAPTSLLRVAYYLSPKIAIEPQFSIDTWSGEGSSQSQIGLGVFVPFYFNGDKGATGFYVAPGIGTTMYSESDEESTSQMFYAAEAGKKFRINESAAFRVAAQYFSEPENDDYFKYSNIGIIVGLSVFLK